jgi:hypothetical protein
MNSIHMSLHSEPKMKRKKVESVMVSCIDNYGSTQIVNRFITPELSLDRLFEIAKEEHLKKDTNQR